MGLFRAHASTLIMDDLREQFKAGTLTEDQFRRQLRRRGYTDIGADSEVIDQKRLKVMGARKYPNGAPMFAADGMMLDENGERSIFDDVDE